MKNKIYILFGIIGFTFIQAQAQKITEGDKKLSFLAGETIFNIRYEYDSMMVGKMTESAYRAKKVSEMNAQQRGKGERWENQWVASRKAKYEPMFEVLINKIFLKSGSAASANQNENDAKYTLLVKTVYCDPGYNVVAMKKYPVCHYEIYWINNADGKVMAKGELKNVRGVIVGGSDFDFDPSNGIKECYAKAGKVIGKTMLKAMKAGK